MPLFFDALHADASYCFAAFDAAMSVAEAATAFSPPLHLAA